MLKWSDIPTDAELRDTGDDILVRFGGSWVSLWLYAGISRAEALHNWRRALGTVPIPEYWPADTGYDWSGGSGTPSARTQPQEAGGGAEPSRIAEKKVTHEIKIKVVVDSTDQPVPGVPLMVKVPNGVFREFTTDANGLIEIKNVEEGSCEAQSPARPAKLSEALAFVRMGTAPEIPSSKPGSPPAPPPPGKIALVEEHKVKTGESIDSLAKANDMTWQELSIFNWGTAVPDQINKHLADDVGCTKKTADGNNYKFDDSDTPGIVYIPKKWSQGGLATDKLHTIRVKQIVPAAILHFVLVSETTGHLLPLCPYTVYDAAGNVIAKGKSDENAEARVAVPSEGEYDVEPGIVEKFTVAGTVFTRVSGVPLANAEIEVRPWHEDKRNATTGAQGEISLSDIPNGELVLAHQGAEYSVIVSENIADGSFFIPHYGQPPSEQEEAGQELNV